MQKVKLKEMDNIVSRKSNFENQKLRAGFSIQKSRVAHIMMQSIKNSAHEVSNTKSSSRFTKKVKSSKIMKYKLW